MRYSWIRLIKDSVHGVTIIAAVNEVIWKWKNYDFLTRSLDLVFVFWLPEAIFMNFTWKLIQKARKRGVERQGEFTSNKTSFTSPDRLYAKRMRRLANVQETFHFFTDRKDLRQLLMMQLLLFLGAREPCSVPYAPKPLYPPNGTFLLFIQRFIWANLERQHAVSFKSIQRDGVRHRWGSAGGSWRTRFLSPFLCRAQRKGNEN